MAEKLTDRTIFSGTVDKDNDLIHLVDVSDTSQDPAGSSFSCVPKKFINSYISSGSETEGQTLYYDATTGKFLNTSIIHIDDSNNFVGVGITSALQAKLHVKSASGTAFQVDGSSITGTFKVENNGDIDGYLLKVNSSSQIAIGTNVTVNAGINVAIGANSISTNSSTAVGYGADAQTSSGSATALGYLSKATTESVAIGALAKANSHAFTTCVGYNAGNTSGILVGFTTRVGYNPTGYSQNIGAESLVFGKGNDATTSHCISIGNHLSTTNIWSYALGTGLNDSNKYVNNIPLSLGIAFGYTTATVLLARNNDSFIDNGTNGFVFGASTVNASAKVQIDSTTKGFLPPRMTTAERDLIATPAEGLVIYNTTLQRLDFYNGTVWGAV